MLYYTTCILCSVVVLGCATVGTPTGGLQDVAAPVMEKCIPSQKTIQFSSNKIAIGFNEYIKIKDVQNIVITPLMVKPMEVLVKSKTIYIHLKDTLRSNTTYTINFGNEITDITEGNALKNFSYVFSTGNFIDSLSIKGQAVLLPEAGAIKDAWVMLHQPNGDSTISQTLPLYFTQTDENGQFEINNIKAGKYLLTALKDENNNKLYDQKNEAIGFCTQPIVVAANNDFKKLYLSKAQRDGQFLNYAKCLEPGVALLVFNKPLTHLYHFTINAQADSLVNHRLTAGRDSMFIYSFFTKADTLKIKLTDTPYDTVIHLLSTVNRKLNSKDVAYTKVYTNLISNLASMDVKKGVNNKGDKKTYYLPYQNALQVFFNHPIKKIEFTKIILKQDSTQKPISLPNIELAPKQNVLLINKDLFVKGHRYQLYLPPAVVEDIYGLANDTFIITFESKGQEDLCKLKLLLKNDSLLQYACVAMLYNSNNEKIAQEKLISGTASFSNLLAGSYGVKLLIDKNDNGHWDAGLYYKKQEPEIIIPYSKNIQLKTGWEQELELK